MLSFDRLIELPLGECKDRFFDGWQPDDMVDDLWYKNKLIYSLDLETFMESDGDGVGDFEGLMRRLDYLHSLGDETLWLAPFHPSPNRTTDEVQLQRQSTIFLRAGDLRNRAAH